MSQLYPDQPDIHRLDSLQDTAWQRQLARPLLIALQITCLITGPWLIIQNIRSISLWGFVPPLAFVLALIGVASAQWLEKPSQRQLHKSAFQVAQIIMVFALVRALTWALGGAWPSLADLRTWLYEPGRFFDASFVLGGLLAALAWHRGAVVGSIFARLALTPGELVYAEDKRRGLWRMIRPSERVLISRRDLVEQYVGQWLVGGVLLALCAAATRVHVDNALHLNVLAIGVPPQIVVAGIFYFLIGLILTSQARFAMLRAQWLQEGVDMADGLPTRWNRLATLLILAVGAAAALLPLGSTGRISDIINALVMVAAQIGIFLAFLVAYAFALLMRLLGEPQPMPEIPQQPLPVQPPPEPPPAVASTPAWLGGASLWMVVVVAVLLAMWFLFGGQGLAVTRAKLAATLAALRSYLKQWTHAARQALQSVSVARSGRNPTAATPTPPPWRFVRVNGLSPREQVRYFYLSAVRRAAEQGVERKPSQTPLEFMHDLEQTWPDAELDVQGLTDAFVAARYDVAEVSTDQSQQVKSIWERVKRALRARRSNKGEKTDESR